MDENIFEESGRAKKLKLGEMDYQWKFADTTPSPESETVARDSGRDVSVSPAHVEEAEETALSGAILRSNSTEQDKPLNQINETDQISSDRENDATVLDEISHEHLAKDSPKADLIDNDHEQHEDTLSSSAGDTPPNGERYTGGLDRLNAHSKLNVDETLEENVSQILPENELSLSQNRGSSISASSTEYISNKSHPQINDFKVASDQGKDDPEPPPKMIEDSMEDDQPHETRSDRPSTPTSRASSAHDPLEDIGTVRQRLKVSTQEKRVSPSGSPESWVEINSALSGSESGLHSPTGTVSEDGPNSDAELSSDLGDEASSVSPAQGPYPDPDYLSDDQPEIASGDREIISIDSDSEAPAEDSQSIHSAADGDELSNIALAPDDMLSDSLRSELDGPSILQTQSRPITIILPGQSARPNHLSPTIPNELERSLPLIDPNVGDVAELRDEALAVDEHSFPNTVNILNTTNAPSDDNITDAKKSNNTQDNDRSITNKSQEEGSAKIGTCYQDRAPDAFSQINADRSGEDFGLDRESAIMVLHEKEDRPSLQKSQEPENDIAGDGDDTHETLDDNELLPQQNHQTQNIRPTKPKVEIIDLESEYEDNDVPEGPLMKASPADESEKADGSIIEGTAVSKPGRNWSGSDDPSLARFHEQKFVGVVVRDAPMTASTMQDDLHDFASPTDQMIEQSTGPNTPAKDHSRLIQERIFRGQDSKLKAEVDDSPQSKMSELEDEIFRDSNLDPIFRKQLFTPSASQQRSLESEPSAVSINSQQEEQKLPTPRLTQSISDPPLPPATPEPQQRPSLIEKIRALKDRSAKTAQARKSNDHSTAASAWFTHKEKSQHTHVSDSDVESEDERVNFSNQLPLIHKEVHTNGPLDSSHPKFTTHSASGHEVIAPKSDSLPAGFRTSLAYYAPLSTLSSHFNTLTSVLATVHSFTPLKQSKSGPRDFHQTLSLTDPSSASLSPITAQIFRPKQVAFPVVNTGDAILLRNFKVQSFSGKLGLLSTNSSAWAVFRSGEDVQVRGPPVEFGAEERGFARGLWSWWGSFRDSKAKATEQKDEEEAVQQLEEETDVRKVNIRRSPRHQTPKRIRQQQQDASSDLVRHELRDGTSYYTDSTPEKATRRKKTDAHELRDGTTYTDIDSDGEAVSKKGRGRTKKGTAKAQGKLNHKLRDGTTYSDDLG